MEKAFFLWVIVKAINPSMSPHKMERWGRRSKQLFAYLEFFMELQECQVWEVLIERSKFILTMGKDVPDLGQESPPSNMGALHWFESSPWKGLAHLCCFFCFGYHKWFGSIAHNYD